MICFHNICDNMFFYQQVKNIINSGENTTSIYAINIVIEFTNSKTVSMLISELGSIESYYKNVKYIG